MDSLLRRGHTFYARFNVPRSRQEDVAIALGLRGKVCRDRVRTLQTTSRAEATQRLPTALAAIRADLDAKLRAAGLAPLSADWRPTWDLDAAKLADMLREADPTPRDMVDHGGGKIETFSDRDYVLDKIGAEASTIEETEGREAAERFYARATATGLTIASALDRWVSELEAAKERRGQTIAGHKAALRLLGDYLKAEDARQFPSLSEVLLEDVTRRVAGGFISWRLGMVSGTSGRPIQPPTVQREMSSFNGLWKWAVRRGYADENPWLDQTTDLPRGRRRAAQTVDDEAEDATKRPYSAAELVKLIRADGEAWAPNGGGYGPALWDAVRLGLLTGCRANEMAGLLVRDVIEGGTAIRIPHGKTSNAPRIIPLCVAAQEVVAARLAILGNPAPGDALWPELPAHGPDKRRGKVLSTRFGVAKRRILMDPLCQREPLGVDLHSLRRSFAEALRNAMNTGRGEVNPNLIAALMGHSNNALALDGYAPGAAMRHLRAAIEAMWEYGLDPEVRQALLETRGERPKAVRMKPMARRAAKVEPVERRKAASMKGRGIAPQ